MSDHSVSPLFPKADDEQLGALFGEFINDAATDTSSSPISGIMAPTTGRSPATQYHGDQNGSNNSEYGVSRNVSVNGMRGRTPDWRSSSGSSTLNFQDDSTHNTDQYPTYTEKQALLKQNHQEEEEEEVPVVQEPETNQPLQEEEDSEKPSMVNTRSQKTKKRSLTRDLSEARDPSHDEPSPQRSLRDRSTVQKYPYRTEKYKFDASKSGRDPKEAEIDRAVKKQVNGTSKDTRKIKASTSPPVKKRKRTQADARSDDDSMSEPPTQELSMDFIAKHTKLFIEVKGMEDRGSVPIVLSNCPDLDTLLAFVNDTWVRHLQADLDSIRCFLGWKDANANIAIARGWNFSFEHLLHEVESAPVWRSKAQDKNLEVKMVATLIPRSTPYTSTRPQRVEDA